MDYYRLLDLDAEPFSNSPDPDFFFRSRQHQSCLQKLELSVRIKRGLNVIIGHVGTGKTTMCRQLIRIFSEDLNCETHLILDPSFASPEAFLGAVASMLDRDKAEGATSQADYKEVIKQALFRKGAEEGKIVTLIIDEAQKAPGFCLEILREFLNFETNRNKLLQIVLFAQPEFNRAIEDRLNFTDRINLFYLLGPLSFADTRRMIEYRLAQSRRSSGENKLFTWPAMAYVYWRTKGYPRQIVNLCHQTMLAMIIQNRKRAGIRLVRSCMARTLPPREKRPIRRHRRALWAGIAFATILLTVGLVTDPFQWVSRLHRFGDAEPVATNEKRFTVIPPLGSEQTVARTDSAPSISIKDSVAKATASTGRSNENEPIGTTLPETSRPANDSDLSSVPVSVNDESVKKNDTDGQSPATLPEVLGQLRLHHHETLSWLMIKIYGYFDNNGLRRLLSANPHVTRPNSVSVGEMVTFPAGSATYSVDGMPAWWILVGDAGRLTDAMDVIRAYPANAMPIRLIPYYNSTEGLRFAIVVSTCHATEESAEMTRLQLPEPYGSQSRVSSNWTPGTMMFSDPYQGFK